MSTEDQAQGDSPEHHEKRARYYAESKGWSVREVYHLEAVSGKQVLQHPEAVRMLKDVRSGHITGLIFSKLARLARNTKELLEIADIFQGLGADLISLQESIDTSTPAGRLFYTMIAAMAQWEREEIAERVSASVLVRAKLGKPLNGRVSFGYQWVDKKIVLHPQEAPIRRLIYEIFDEVHRKRTVAKMLNERGLRTREGKLFSDVSIEYLIRDPTAKGMHRANYTTRHGPGGKVRVVKPKDQWIWNEVEPIVSEELWQRCNDFLDTQRATKYKRLGRRPVHLFTGLVFCECGKKMYVRTTSPKYLCDRCLNKMAIMDLEAVFQEQLKGYFVSPTEVARRVAEADKHLQEKSNVLVALEAEQSKVKQEVERVYRLFNESQLDADGFGRFFRPLQERERQMEVEIPRLQAEVDLLKINHLSTDRILSEATDLYSRWPQLSREEKRRIVDSVTEKIVVGKDEVSITLCSLPSSEELTKEQSKLCRVTG